MFFATRVAESSITLPNVACVIDCGYDWQDLYDPDLRTYQRRLERISQASSRQRRGRTGRTCSGRYIQMFSRQAAKAMPRHPVPGVLRDDLAPVALDLRACGQDPTCFRWISPPRCGDLVEADQRLIALQTIPGFDASPLASAVELSEASSRAATVAETQVLRQLGLQPWLGALVLRGMRRNFTTRVCSDIVQLASLIDLGAIDRMLPMQPGVMQLIGAPRGDPITLLRVYKAWKQAMAQRGSKAALAILQAVYSRHAADDMHGIFGRAETRAETLVRLAVRVGVRLSPETQKYTEASLPDEALDLIASDSREADALHACVRDLSDAYVEHPTGIESDIAVLLGWALNDRLAARNVGRRAGYSVSRAGKWLGIVAS